MAPELRGEWRRGEGRLVAFFCFQRARAAVIAVRVSSSSVSVTALALPPFFPPLAPRFTASGFLPSSSRSAGGTVLGTCPVASSITRWAVSFTSGRSFFFLAMLQSNRVPGGSQGL